MRTIGSCPEVNEANKIGSDIGPGISIKIAVGYLSLPTIYIYLGYILTTQARLERSYKNRI